MTRERERKWFLAICVVGVILFSGVCCVSVLSAPIASQIRTSDAGDYYLYMGTKVPLLRSLEEVTIGFEKEASERKAAELLGRTLGAGKFKVSRVLKKNQATVCSISGLTKNEDVESLIAVLKKEADVKWVYPVFVERKGKTRVIMTDEFGVQLRAGATDADLQNLCQQIGAVVVRKIRLADGQYLLRVAKPKERMTLDVANAAYATAAVEWAEPDFYCEWKLCYTPNDPKLPDQWHLSNIGQGGGKPGADVSAFEAWDVTPGGNPNIVIAIIDDGVELGHEDLAPNIWVNPGEAFNGIDDDGNGYMDDINGWDFFDDNYDPNPKGDNDEHGVSVAGVAAAVGDNATGVCGAAYRAKILAVKVARYDTASGPGFASDSVLGEAIRYAASIADVLNNSWGGGLPSAPIDSAIAYAVTHGRGGKGCVVLFASGNSADQGLPFVGYPASNPLAIAVGASTNLDKRSFYSQYGPMLDFVAPSNGGTLGITTTDRTGGFGYDGGDYTSAFGGTSSATPLSAGVAALVLSVNPNLRWDEVRWILRETCDKIGEYEYVSGRNLYYGNGRINAYQAVLAASQPVAMPTPVPANYYVDCGLGSDLYGDGSLYNPWRTLTYAISRTSEGDTIGAAGGTYDVLIGETFPIRPKSGMTIVGDTKFLTPTIEGPWELLSTNDDCFRCIGVSNVTLRNLFIMSGFNGITARDASLTLDGCSLWQNDYDGIQADNASLSIFGSYVYGNGRYGIFLVKSSAQVVGNALYGNTAYGIFFNDSSGGLVENNLLYDNGTYGVCCSRSSPPLIRFNEFDSAGTTAHVACFDGSDPEIAYNTFLGTEPAKPLPSMGSLAALKLKPQDKPIVASSVVAQRMAASAPQSDGEVIVDNDDGSPAYMETGVWTTGLDSGYNGLTYRYAQGGDAATATWTGYLSQTGYYDVSTIYRRNADRVTAAAFIIHASDGDHAIDINQNGADQIVETHIGTFPFDAGDNSITLNASTSTPSGDMVIADAVRFVYVLATPTPSPTPEAALQIVNPSVQHVTAKSAVIIFDTNKEAVEGWVTYGIAPDVLDEDVHLVSTGTHFEIELRGLDAMTTYYYRIYAKTALGKTASYPVLSSDPPQSFSTEFWNTATGIRADYSSPHVHDNYIAGATEYGIYTSESGGRVERNEITQVLSVSGSVNAAAVYANSRSGLLVSSNIFFDNGLAISCARSSPLIVNNMISAPGLSSIMLAEGIEVNRYSNPTIVNNTITGTAIGILCDEFSSAKVRNCIIWGNSVDLLQCGAEYSDTGMGIAGTGNIALDPLLIDDGMGRYYLDWDSPCIDAGSASYAPATDFEGDSRPLGAAPDMGADEFRTNWSWGFGAGAEGWTFGSAPGYLSEPTPSVSGNALGLTTHTNTNCFGYWQSPWQGLEGFRDNLYRARFAVATDVTPQALVPQIRLRAIPTTLQQADYLTISSIGDGAYSPTPAGRTYDLYFIPPPCIYGTGESPLNVFLTFDVLNFAADDAAEATVQINSVSVDRVSVNDLTGFQNIVSYEFATGQEGWTSSGVITPFTPPAAYFAPEVLALQAADNTNCYGFWTSPVRTVPIEANRLYRAHFVVATDQTESWKVPTFRVRVQADNLQASVAKEVVSSGDSGNSPSASNTCIYPVYIYPPQEAVGTPQDGLSLAFEIMNFNPADSGDAKLFLMGVYVQSLDIPAIP
jgi:parallel beta-helix repeat protein